MAVIEWKPAYATGIVALDNEHKGLIAELNRLYEAMRDKRGQEVLGATIAMLERYTVDHFQHEEKLMEEYQFPGLAEHRLIHQGLIEDVAQLKERSSGGDEALARELLKFLREWVLNHIMEVDQQYGPYLEARGGRFIE
jgi:hemerythrin